MVDGHAESDKAEKHRRPSRTSAALTTAGPDEHRAVRARVAPSVHMADDELPDQVPPISISDEASTWPCENGGKSGLSGGLMPAAVHGTVAVVRE